MTDFDYSPTRQCSYDMSRDEVNQVLQDELDLLRDELRRRDKVVDELIETVQKKVEEARKRGNPYDSGFHPAQDEAILRNIQVKNMEIHDDLRPEGVTNV